MKKISRIVLLSVEKDSGAVFKWRDTTSALKSMKTTLFFHYCLDFLFIMQISDLTAVFRGKLPQVEILHGKINKGGQFAGSACLRETFQVWTGGGVKEQLLCTDHSYIQPTLCSGFVTGSSHIFTDCSFNIQSMFSHWWMCEWSLQPIILHWASNTWQSFLSELSDWLECLYIAPLTAAMTKCKVVFSLIIHSSDKFNNDYILF